MIDHATPVTPNSISVTQDGLIVWQQWRAIYRCPVDRFPALIARLARQLELSAADAPRTGENERASRKRL